MLDISLKGKEFFDIFGHFCQKSPIFLSIYCFLKRSGMGNRGLHWGHVEGWWCLAGLPLSAQIGLLCVEYSVCIEHLRWTGVNRLIHISTLIHSHKPTSWLKYLHENLTCLYQMWFQQFILMEISDDIRAIITCKSLLIIRCLWDYDLIIYAWLPVEILNYWH